YKLNLDKKLFEYSTNELNSLLESLREGQSLYENYKDYAKYNLLNPIQYVGDNPFLVEREIKEAFGTYKAQIEEIYKSIGKFKIEYRKLRDKEVEETHKKILDKVTGIRTAYASLINDIKKAESAYIAARTTEIEN